MSKKMKNTMIIGRLCLCIIFLCIIPGVGAKTTVSAFEEQFTVELALTNTTLKNVVNALKKQTNILFSYDKALESLKVNNVSIKAENENIENILDQVFKDTGIRYKIEDQIVVLSGSTAHVSTVHTSVQQDTKKITGSITDASGEPIIGANILAKGTSIGTITDINGEFQLEVPQNAVLVVTYIGYFPQEVVVGNQTTLKVTLKEDTKTLDEVVVIGYGKMKKGDLSAAVGTLSNADKLLERPITSAEEMLQGQIPGVTITSNGGHPDSKPSLIIRGMGSPASETPLYVVDGVPGAPFNVSDVVNITVLKDAASAAIYGAYAGSAGVILVTTKQASAGRTTVDYSVVAGISQATNLPQSLTIEEQRRVRAFALGGEEQLPAGWDVLKNPYIGETRTDWIDEIFRTAPFQRHNIAISGGTDEFSNRISLEISDRQGTLINTYNKSVTARLNSMWKISKYLRVREDLSFQDIKKRGANTSSAESGVILSALMMPRNAEVYNPDGSFGGTAPSDKAYIDKYGSNYADIHGDVVNPVRSLKADYNKNNRSTLTSSTFLEIIEPIKGLNFTSRFTYKLESYFLRTFSPRRLEPGKPFDNNSLTYESSRAPNWEFENTLNYDRVFNRHNVSLMASTTSNENSYRRFEVIGRNFGNETASLMYFSQAGNFDPAEDSFSKDRNMSVVGRMAYSFADRYFLTASWRRDYAGRLPKGNKYGDYPAVTAAWKITSEEFMPESDILKTLKLRASWGRIGNLGSISMGYGYPVLSNYVIGNDVGGQVGINNPIAIGKYLNEGYNPNLTWETSEQLDLGLDAELFNNRLSIGIDYFMKKTKDLIRRQDSGWTNSIGLDAKLVNQGEIRNSGFEFSASWNDRVGNVNYWVSGNLSTLKNEVYNIGPANEQGEKPVWTDGASYKNLSPFRSVEGKPLYSFYLIKTDGVFTSQDEIDRYVDKNGNKIQPNAQVGDLKFIDEDGSGKIDAGDRVFMGNAMPKVTYALSGGFNWKDFNFSMMLQGVSGVKIFNAYKHTTLNESLGNFNRSREILKALDGPNKDVPRISAKDSNGNFTNPSDYYLEKGDYLRIKNISIGYSLTRLLQKWGYMADRKSTLDLTFSIDNLATFTSYSGIDPEVGSTPESSVGSRPDAPTYSYGMDRGQYPTSRTYSVALKFKF